MSLEQVFSILNAAVIPAWLLLALLPRWKGTRVLVHSFLYPLVYGIVYISFLIAAMFFGHSAEGTGMSSIAGVSALFSHPVGALTGWTHYLVFDLFVGAWISRDAIVRGVTYWLVIPCLLMTLVFGPVGLALYFLLRLATGRGGFNLENDRSETNR